MTDDQIKWIQRMKFVGEMLRRWDSRPHPPTETGDIAAMDMIVTHAILFGREHDAQHRPPEPEKLKRVPVQIAISEGHDWSMTRVIANDGTMWETDPATQGWSRIPCLPQD